MFNFLDKTIMKLNYELLNIDIMLKIILNDLN
jgi:hypothetical protein